MKKTVICLSFALTLPFSISNAMDEEIRESYETQVDTLTEALRINSV